MHPVVSVPRSDAIDHHDAVARLAAAVLRQALRDGDARFFADGAMLAFWCDVAGLSVEAVRACYRRLAAGVDSRSYVIARQRTGAAR